jgi:hypothetical protein
MTRRVAPPSRAASTTTRAADPVDDLDQSNAHHGATDRASNGVEGFSSRAKSNPSRENCLSQPYDLRSLAIENRRFVTIY